MKKITALVVCIGLTSSLVASSGIQRCKACHGQDFEKKAMGVSKVVKDMNKDDIIEALNGYKNGFYGDKMKAIMEGQVKSLSDKNIENIAEEITKKDSLGQNITEEMKKVQNIKENFKSDEINSTKVKSV